jgi:acyl-CoA reductase-like NAD-dependent aldehyde dehydrogenase
MELGGSDPFIVLDDADIEKAAEAAVAGRFLNCGQSCIAAKRIVVVKNVAPKFIEKFTEHTKSLKVGDPMKEETNLGPMVRDEQRKKLDEQIKSAIESGAKMIVEGGRPPAVEGARGYFFNPVVLANVKNDMNICQQEVFGPVAPIIVVENEAEAINVANDTPYGLGASLWTKSERAEKIIHKIASGMIFVNETVKSDPRLPFSGMKKSGLGSELARHGFMEMLRPRTVVIN